MANTGTSAPAVARRRVSLALRRAREAKKWTQTQVATAMEWSLSKVMRIEKGQVNISPTDLRAVLQILDVTDETEVDELLADARVSRSERYATDDYDREHLTPTMVQLFQYETVATRIRHYNNVTLPGLMQTRAYAQAMLENDVSGLDAITVKARLESRLRRRERALRRSPRPDYLAILDEAVLRRTAGDSRVMAEQMDELGALIDEHLLRVRIVPFALSAPIVHLGPFMVLDFTDTESSMLYREGPLTDEIVTQAEDVERHSAVFDRLWPLILDDHDSRAMIEEAARTHRTVH